MDPIRCAGDWWSSLSPSSDDKEVWEEKEEGVGEEAVEVERVEPILDDQDEPLRSCGRVGACVWTGREAAIAAVVCRASFRLFRAPGVACVPARRACGEDPNEVGTSTSVVSRRRAAEEEAMAWGPFSSSPSGAHGTDESSVQRGSTVWSSTASTRFRCGTGAPRHARGIRKEGRSSMDAMACMDRLVSWASPEAAEEEEEERESRGVVAAVSFLDPRNGGVVEWEDWNAG